MSDKKKERAQDEQDGGEKDAKGQGAGKKAGVVNLNDTLEKVFQNVALIDRKESISLVMEELGREVRAVKTEMSAEEMAQYVLGSMQPQSREFLLEGLMASIFQKKAKLRSQSMNKVDELAPGAYEGAYPYVHNYDDALYKEELYGLQVELLKLQRHVKETGMKLVVLFEGRDAAGKGGTIGRFTENINPRGARVVALPKPSEAQAGQWYFQRYAEQLPSPGEIVFFDRSWYNRAVVEPVMGFCTPRQTNLFLNEVPGFERSLVEHGIHLTKFWLDVSREEQKRRFKQRRVDPVRRWKLSPVDIASLDKWDEYTVAIEQMFRKTESPDAPWTIIRSDDKRRARLNAIRVFLHSIEYAEKDEEQIGAVDGLIVKSVPEYLRGYRR